MHVCACRRPVEFWRPRSNQVAQFALVDWIVLFNYVGDVSCDDVTCRYAGPPTEHADDFECSRHTSVRTFKSGGRSGASGRRSGWSSCAGSENGFLPEVERSTHMHSMFPGSPPGRTGRGKEWLLRTRYVVSHAWIQAGHPDPERVQQKALVRELTKCLLEVLDAGHGMPRRSLTTHVCLRVTIGQRRKKELFAEALQGMNICSTATGASGSCSSQTFLRAGLTGSGVGDSPKWPSAVPRTRSSISPRLTLGSRRKVINVD